MDLTSDLRGGKISPNINLSKACLFFDGWAASRNGMTDIGVHRRTITRLLLDKDRQAARINNSWCSVYLATTLNEKVKRALQNRCKNGPTYLTKLVICALYPRKICGKSTGVPWYIFSSTMLPSSACKRCARSRPVSTQLTNMLSDLMATQYREHVIVANVDV